MAVAQLGFVKRQHTTPMKPFDWWGFGVRGFCGGLLGAHKRAHKLPVHERRDCFHFKARLGQEFARVLRAVDARGLDFDRLEAGGSELGAVLRLFQCSRNAPCPKLHASADGGWHFATNHHVRDGKAAAGLEHSIRFAEDAVLVRRKIDDAIRDYDVHRSAGKRDVLDLTL